MHASLQCLKTKHQLQNADQNTVFTTTHSQFSTNISLLPHCKSHGELKCHLELMVQEQNHAIRCPSEWAMLHVVWLCRPASSPTFLVYIFFSSSSARDAQLLDYNYEKLRMITAVTAKKPHQCMQAATSPLLLSSTSQATFVHTTSLIAVI